jgi:hypothetical protein
MALTEFQRTLCRIIAQHHLASVESYVAGGVALNTLTDAARVSRDIDLFHDTTEAVTKSSHTDRQGLESHGYQVKILRERDGFVEAEVSKEDESVIVQWAADSAFRFFPLVRHEDLGLTLHPFDLATNKVLALVGRLEARDWVDVINCHERIQRLGYLAWAASGKDPGFSPAAILDQAGRSSRYSAAEIGALAFDGPPPDAAELSQKWHAMLNEGRELVGALPSSEVGACVLDPAGNLFMGDIDELRAALTGNDVRFHEGRIHGAVPRLLPKKSP